MSNEKSRTRSVAAVSPLPIGAADETARDDLMQRREQTRQQYVLAAILFVGGGVGAVLPDALHEPAHPPTIYLLPLLAIVSGAVTFALAPRLPRSALHVVAVVAALEVALTAGLADQIFAVYFTFIAIFAAYVLESRRAIAAHVGFVCLLAFVPLLYAPDDARENLIQALVLVPTFVLAGGAVAFLRERLAASESRYRQLSEVDPLTGVGNYRMLSLRVPRELRRHRRHGRPLTLLVIDLDDFKRINDSYGHQRGDAVLQEVAAALLDSVRGDDIVVRQGGDEFAVVAPETDESEAHDLARRLGEAIASVAPDGSGIGASIGAAYFPADAETLEGLLAAADARLRGAKGEKTVSYDRDHGSRRAHEPLG
ncbi:MAG: GGDEF domain-containing protein [Thermoleophilales bacterium]|nr:GGDEF domain-containing protein [Thermoleophilales bacterium]